MAYPDSRLRRVRMTAGLRGLVRENRVHPEQLVMPLFIVPGSGIEREISSLPGQFHRSVDRTVEYARKLCGVGIGSVLLFGIPTEKDEEGRSAIKPDGIVQKACRALKSALPELVVITDLCFCEYTSHGHCGIIKNGLLDNDATLPLLASQAISHAEAGADVIAPSGMLDGMVTAIRGGLDESGFPLIPIMSYSAKYASAFYGPFREAVNSAPQFGDRRSYQMDCSNSDEAMREIASDLEEGADIVMVKPALPFLDIIRRGKDEFQVPMAAYNVSGEYAMLKAAERQGWIDGPRAMVEMLTCIKRAGADIIITYFAHEFADSFR